jgi:hypothetical protein
VILDGEIREELWAIDLIGTESPAEHDFQGHKVVYTKVLEQGEIFEGGK